ncbi:MAG: isoaspartyl peptidase/L-asparaginase [Anaerolineae bacterium]|nr:isoaspartyl peptidase/L-asparaginase [Anaerolineae bacterium]
MITAMIVHGGAWDIPDELVEAHRQACLAAVQVGWTVLQSGGSALDAVEQAIMLMEDDPALDAGIGAFLNADGEVELDAGLMDGATLKAGSVAAVQRVRHPIALARKVMESDHVLLVGHGAEQFAEKHSIERCPSALLVIPRELDRWMAISQDCQFHVRQAFMRRTGPFDTVGAVALDEHGHIAAGTSTGGIPHKLPGRVGDSPLVGCGYYADDELGGASCTGWGEGIMRVVLAKAAVDRLAQDEAMSAARWSVDYLQRRVNGLGGIIVLDRQGRIGCACNTPRMAYAYMQGSLIQPMVHI